MNSLYTYLPQDRRRALNRGETLPDRTSGSALFADISGFTALTEALTQQLGQRRGIEELTRQVNGVYDALIAEIEKYDGSVIAFAGDAITCWFDGESALQAVTAALALQAAMTAFPKLGLKVAVTTGPARRFVVGDPAVQRLDALAGATIARLSVGEHLAATGEVLTDLPTAAALTDTVSFIDWRMAENGERFARVKQLTARSLYEESLALRREMDDKRGISGSLNNLGIVANRQGDYATARALHEESMALRCEIGDKWGISSSLFNLGNVAYNQGDYASARALHEESLTLNREMGDRSSVAGSLNNLGNLAIEQGDPETAQASYQESLALCKDIGDKRTAVYNFSGLAAVAVYQADLPRAARLASVAETLRLHMNQVWEAVGGRIHERTVTAARAGLSKVEFNSAWSVGEQMTLDEAIEFALKK